MSVQKASFSAVKIKSSMPRKVIQHPKDVPYAEQTEKPIAAVVAEAVAEVATAAAGQADSNTV